MLNFILATLFWTVVLYGLLEFIKKVIYWLTYPSVKGNDTYMIITVKNGEEYIEGLLKSMNFKVCSSNLAKEIIVVDLNSSDMTCKILNKLEKDNENIKIMTWEKCKEFIDNLILTNN